MTIVDAQAPQSVLPPPPQVTIELVAWWQNTWLARAVDGGATVFSCLVGPPDPGSHLLHEMLPQRHDPRLPICAMIEGKPNCSTPAIACIKKAYVCTRPAGIK